MILRCRVNGGVDVEVAAHDIRSMSALKHSP